MGALMQKKTKTGEIGSKKAPDLRRGSTMQVKGKMRGRRPSTKTTSREIIPSFLNEMEGRGAKASARRREARRAQPFLKGKAERAENPEAERGTADLHEERRQKPGVNKEHGGGSMCWRQRLSVHRAHS